VCYSPAREQAEALLAAGTSGREVARLTGLRSGSAGTAPRSHGAGGEASDGPAGDAGGVDPMREALPLFEAATT
jgi:hypothetical protein